MHRIPLLVITGPTATGKTRIAVEVARAVGAEIINADSMQIYRGMDIGTAKPTADEKRLARFHLIDIVNPDEPYSVVDFKRDAYAAAIDIADRRNLPILCGGTGLYARAVTEGLVIPPRPEDETVRRDIEEQLALRGADAIHARLRAVDPGAAARIHPHDHKRIVRALEVYRLTGRPMSEQQTVDAPETIPYNAAKFVIHRPREVIYEAIERRIDDMLDAGWLAEVRRLVAHGYGSELQSMQAIGYRLLAAHLGGELELGEATRLIKRDTRRFAKRQLTWFRRQPDSTWLLWTAEPDIPPIVDRLVDVGDRLKRGYAG